MGWFKDAFQQHPEFLIFLAVAGGYLVGKIPMGRGAKIGLIPGTLVVGLVLGDVVDVSIPPVIGNLFFVLFLFAIGYKVGPQFFAGLRSNGLRQASVAAVIALTGLAISYAVARALGFNPGEGAGLLSGGLTQTAAIGSATEAINQLDVDDATRASYAALVPVGFAVTYFFGTAGAAWWVSSVMPKVLRLNLPKEAETLERDLGQVPTESGTAPAYYPVVQRAYRVTSPQVIGRTIGDLESQAAARGHRTFTIRLRRGEELLEPDPDLVIEAGDIVAVTARRESLVAENVPELGDEVDDADLLDYEIETAGAVITHEGFAGRTIADLRSHALGRGVFIDHITRAGISVPVVPEATVQAGDELFLTGPTSEVEATARQIGFLERLTSTTDILFVSTGIVLGGLIGIPSWRFGGAEFGLSTSVGALVVGLVFGWLRSRRPTFGRVPPAAQWVFDTYAFALAIAVIGINAGPKFVSGIQESGVKMLLGGVVVTLVPLTVGVLYARLLVKMRVPLALGAVAGGQTSTPTLASVNETSHSEIATLGYTVPYAVSNVLLTLWGSVIVILLAR